MLGLFYKVLREFGIHLRDLSILVLTFRPNLTGLAYIFLNTLLHQALSLVIACMPNKRC